MRTLSGPIISYSIPRQLTVLRLAARKSASIGTRCASKRPGAALMALTSLGGCADLHAAVALLAPATRRIEPDPDAYAVYARLQPVFAAIPATLAPFYAELSQFQREFP